MTFDADYFNRISEFFNKKDDIIYPLGDLTDNPDKFIFHVKYYIENRRDEMVYVEFNNDFTKLKVYEFFEGKIKEFDPNKIPPWVWDAPAPEPRRTAPPVQVSVPTTRQKPNKTLNLFE